MKQTSTRDRSGVHTTLQDHCCGNHAGFLYKMSLGRLWKPCRENSIVQWAWAQKHYWSSFIDTDALASVAVVTQLRVEQSLLSTQLQHCSTVTTTVQKQCVNPTCTRYLIWECIYIYISLWDGDALRVEVACCKPKLVATVLLSCQVSSDGPSEHFGHMQRSLLFFSCPILVNQCRWHTRVTNAG